MSSEVVIKVDAVSKRYERYEAPRDRLKEFVLPKLQRIFRLPVKTYFSEFVSLHDISFSVKRGETLGIVGKNGAGKSTLLQILCGTLSATEGNVQINGRVAALLELGAGFNPEFSGRENVHMNARLLGLNDQQIEERFDAIAEFADIGEFLDEPVKTYSSGMYVRLAFAVIAHVDADILIIDEALAVGDAYFSQKCMRFLRAFKERGTLLFVSHDAGAVVNLCERAIWLEKGRLVEIGEAKNVMQAYLEELYGGNAQPSKSSLEPSAPSSSALVNEQASATPVQASPNPSVVSSFALEPTAQSEVSRRFGTGLAVIKSVKLLVDSENSVTWVAGGETVRIAIHAESHVVLKNPIVGFIIKDRLGQHLFGDNTFQSYWGRSIECEPAVGISAHFDFVMPILPKGEYSIAAAIADGSQHDHVVHEWVHEALIFQSHSQSVVTGLVGVPMLSIALANDIMTSDNFP